MVSAAGGWETFPLTELIKEVEKTTIQGKYLIIHDKQGNVGTFYNYKGFNLEWTGEALKAAMGKQTADQAMEKLRSSFVVCANIGQHMLINLGTGSADFKKKWTHPTIFDTNILFDFVEGRKKENVKKFIKPEEDHGPGDDKYQKFELKEGFSITFCTNGDDAAAAALVEGLPHADKMRKIIIV